MDCYGLLVEIPSEMAMVAETKDIPKGSVSEKLLEMQKRYTFGVNFCTEANVIIMIFQKLAERDFARNELWNMGVDSLRMNTTLTIADWMWTDSGQAKIRKSMTKGMKKRGKK